MKRPVPTTYSTSLRLPLKICGLFDTGLAGGALDVTSLDFNGTSDLICGPFSLEGLKSGNFTFFNSVSDSDAEEELVNVQPQLLDVYNPLDSLSDLETNQLMDDTLDVLVNLDQLMGSFQDTFLDQPVDIEPINDGHMYDKIAFTPGGTDLFFQEKPVLSKSRKRKATGELVTSDLSLSHMFEIAVSETLESAPFYKNYPQQNDCIINQQQMSTVMEGKHVLLNDNKEKLHDKKIINDVKKSFVTEASPLHVFSTPSTDVHRAEVIHDSQVAKPMKNVSNNKSEEQRKHKFSELDEEAERLIKANASLRLKIAELEKMVTEMKAELFAKMIGK